MGSDLVSPLGVLPPGWRLAELRDIATKIGSGATPKGGESVYLESRSKFVLVRSQNVHDRHFDDSNLAFISDSHASELRGAELKPGDLLLNITGDGVTFARSCLVPHEILPACVNQHVSIIRLQPGGCLPGYLLAYLTHPEIKGYMESFNAGGSRRAITKGNIESFRVPIPPVDQQEEISEILGALDDKIELSRRMNQTLEAMARAIFKSWFVDFEPVSEGQSWLQERRSIGALVRIQNESINPSDLNLEFFSHFSIPAFDEGRLPRTEVGGSIKSNKFLVPKDAVLLSKLNPRIPRVWLPSTYAIPRAICSTEFLVVVPRMATDREFIYSLFCSPEFMERFASRTTGTSGSHQRVRPADLLQMDLLVPIPEARRTYSETVGPLLSKIAQTLEESQTLAALRDTLLPKLLSGEIRVKQAEKIVGDAL